MSFSNPEHHPRGSSRSGASWMTEEAFLRAKLAQTQAALLTLLSMPVKGHQLQDRLCFTPEGRSILEQARAALEPGLPS